MREISAGIIVYHKTLEGPKFLIMYHGRGYWNFPKGKIQAEEKSFQAAIREVKEETGLNRNELKFIEYFKAYEKFVFRRKNEKIFKIVIFYLAETKQIQVRVSAEHGGYGWFSYREALKILSKYKDSQRVLAQANDFLHRQIK